MLDAAVQPRVLKGSRPSVHQQLHRLLKLFQHNFLRKASKSHTLTLRDAASAKYAINATVSVMGHALSTLKSGVFDCNWQSKSRRPFSKHNLASFNGVEKRQVCRSSDRPLFFFAFSFHILCVFFLPCLWLLASFPALGCSGSSTYACQVIHSLT